MRALALILIIAAAFQCGCRYDPGKAPAPLKNDQPGNSFVIGSETSRVEGTVVVQDSGKVPKLVVNVHGE